MSATGGPEAGDPVAHRLEAAYGWWPSPWSASVVAAGKISRGGLHTDAGSVYWTESRPDEGGRQVVVEARPGLPPRDVSPVGVSVRSRLHEYGGGAATVAGGLLFYVDQADQRWYRAAVGEASLPVALSPESPPGTVVRYADGRVTPSGCWLVSIEERAEGSSTRHRLVAVAVDGSQSVVSLVEHGDFVSAPRPSPDGRRFAWMTWDHPSMPWDSSEVWLADLEDSPGMVRLDDMHRVAGGDGVSVGQPRWFTDGSLLFADDRSGWWLPYRLDPRPSAGGVRDHCLVDREAEFHSPDWVVGQSTMAELSDGSLVCRMREGGRDHVVRLLPPGGTGAPSGEPGPGPWSLETIEQPCVSISGLTAPAPGEPSRGGPGVGPDRVCVIGSTPTEAHLVVELLPDAQGTATPLTTGPGFTPAPGDVSWARPFSAPTTSGDVPGLFFAPANTRFTGPAGQRPPLVVFCHGGPTSSAEVGFDPLVQYFTSRGLAVAVVDYRGSSGYGRAYRRALDGLWGEADIDDCVRYAVALESAGRVDGSRMAIRGTSAGGLTALGALIRSRRFVGAAAWYGVTDLEALVAETHDFESRYVDSLVGPWPQCAERYRARSPLHHAEQVSGAVLLLQGEDDPVVPAAQSQSFADQLRRHRVPCRLTLFPGESHGFRRADTIEASLAAEVEFYRSLFGPAQTPLAAAPEPP